MHPNDLTGESSARPFPFGHGNQHRHHSDQGRGRGPRGLSCKGEGN